MNDRDELRVIEALQALTGGLIVTDQDIFDADRRFKDGLEPPSPRRRLAMVAVAVGAAAAVVVGVVAFRAIDDRDASPAPANQPPTPAEVLTDALEPEPYGLDSASFTKGTPVTAETLAGLWITRPKDENPAADGLAPVLMYVDGDGDWRIGHPTAPLTFGESTLSGSTWTRHLDERSQCAKNKGMVGVALASQAVIARDASLRVQFENAGECTPLGDREVWDRVAPGSPVMNYFEAVASDITWSASMDFEDVDADPAEVLYGAYVAPGSGHLLMVSHDGSYRYYDDLTPARLVPADQGVLDITQGTMTATCAGGSFTGRAEVGETPGVAGYVQPLRALRTNAQSGCGSSLLEQDMWIRLFIYETQSPFRE